MLLDQYRHNLASWRDATRHAISHALEGARHALALLLLLLAAVFVAGELWRRAVFSYVQEARRRYQLLLCARS